MDGLTSLSPEVSWTPSSLPSGRFVVFTDRLSSNGAFLLHHFLALFLKAGTLA